MGHAARHGRPLARLQSCTVDEFLELMSDRFEVSREALVARAGLATGRRENRRRSDTVNVSGQAAAG